MLYLLAIAEMRKQQESVVREIRMLRLMRGAKGLAPTLLVQGFPSLVPAMLVLGYSDERF